MSVLVELDCGHRQVLAEVGEIPPAGIPWVLYPLDEGTTVEPGDGMTCVTCGSDREVRETA